MSKSAPPHLWSCGRPQVALTCLAVAAGAAFGQETPQRTLTAQDLEMLKWRSIGPANMSGRVAAIALAPGNPGTYYVGYATGGIFKTVNNGTTFSPIFDDKETASIGAIVVCDAPADWPGWADVDSKRDADEKTEDPDKG